MKSQEKTYSFKREYRRTRANLFRKDRPFVKVFRPEDMGVLWAAYKTGTFQLPDLNQEEFTSYIGNTLSNYSDIWLIEDIHKKFNDGHGPIGLVLGMHNGWETTIDFQWFNWATARNKLRSSVSFLHKSRYDKKVGVFTLHGDDSFHRLTKYGVLFKAGVIPKYDGSNDRYIYYQRGRKSWQK